MLSYRGTKKQPFWSLNDENKPSNKLFNEFISSMESIDYLFVNENNFGTLTIKCSYDGYKYFEITSDNNKYYYFVDSINYIDTSGYEYILKLDIYSTFTRKFIYDNIDIPVTSMRTHTYKPECLEFNDSLIDSVPKIYNSYHFVKSLYPVTNDNIWYSQNIGIQNPGCNANKYFVFKSGVNDGYSFYPILSESNNVTVYLRKYVPTTLYKSYTFKNIRYKSDDIVSIPSSLNNDVNKAYSSGRVVKWYYREVGTRYEFPADKPYLGNWKEIKNTPFGIRAIDLKVETDYWKNAGEGLRAGRWTVYLLGNQIYEYKHTNYTSSAFSKIEDLCKNYEFKVEIYNSTSTYESKISLNSFEKLTEFRKKQENINKFLGVYYLPHLLNFKEINQKDGYIYININPTGEHIDFFKIYQYDLSGIVDKLNNPTPSTPYILKYYDIKYFGNKINIEYRLNEQLAVYLGTKIYFTDVCSIVSKSSDYLSLSDSTISYPYQLPIGVDTYEQYVKANRNVTETSFSIEREKYNLNFASQLFSSIISPFKDIANIAGNLLDGDIGGVTSAAGNMISGYANRGFQWASLSQGIKHQEQQIRAQYQQQQMTRGNQIQFSSIKDAALTEYYDSNGEQFEGVESIDLDTSTITLINNIIYLYGYYCPTATTLKELLNESRIFNWVQIDTTLLSQHINITYDSRFINNNVYMLIMNELSNGVRIWNEENTINIPEYSDNDNWLPQPTPPASPEPVGEQTFYIDNTEVIGEEYIFRDWNTSEENDSIGYYALVNGEKRFIEFEIDKTTNQINIDVDDMYFSDNSVYNLQYYLQWGESDSVDGELTINIIDNREYITSIQPNIQPVRFRGGGMKKKLISIKVNGDEIWRRD